MNLIAKSHLFERRLANYLLKFQLKAYPANHQGSVKYPIIFTKVVPPLESMSENGDLHRITIMVAVQTKLKQSMRGIQQNENLTGTVHEALVCLLNANFPDELIPGLSGVENMEYNDIDFLDDTDGIPVYSSETNIDLIG